MNRNNVVRVFENFINKNYILSVIEKFLRVRELIFYRGDLEKIVENYLNFDKCIIENKKQIQKLNDEMNYYEKLKFELLNRTVIDLRRENKLVNWLDNLNMEELNELKNIVSIENEFKKIDNYRFNKSKSERGKLEFEY